MSYSRAEIIIDKTNDVIDLVKALAAEPDKYTLENFDASLTVDAKSYLGMLYASADFNSPIYLVNKTNDGHFPAIIDNYRA